MKDALRILHLEANPSDVDEAVAALAAEGIACEFLRVETRADFVAALEQSGFDLIFAEYSLPNFDAPSALAIAIEKSPDTPFILVSGTVGEQTAVELLKKGATDYVVKHRLFKLPIVIRRAFGQAAERSERRRAEEKAEQNLQRIRALHEIENAIAAALDLSDVLRLLLEKIELFSPFPVVATVRLLNRESGEVEPLVCRNLDEAEWRINKKRTPSGRAKRICETKASLVVRNIQTDPQTFNQELYRQCGLVSFLGVPLIAKGHSMGVLSVYTKMEHEFCQEEIEFLYTLADQAAIAIHNAQLYDGMARANRVKDEFLGVMSHELRTPLIVLLGYIGLLKDGMMGEVNKQQENALEKLLGCAVDEINVINTIMLTTQIEARTITREYRSLELSDLLDHLRSTYKVQTDKKDVKLTWSYPTAPARITTDGEKLKQTLHNLINNALKFTDKGTVAVTVRALAASKVDQGSELSSLDSYDASKQRMWVEFRVTDTGIGISKETHRFIFDKFYQVDSSQTRAYGGVGLGLYIVKKFTDLLGGQIELESESGKGSTFAVTIPSQS